MELPLVTVITITRNRGDLIGRCIKSIQSQTYNNFEHIIVDGASTDNTEEIVNSFNNNRIKYFKTTEEKAGYIDCYEKAFSETKGRYLCFLDDDDEYLPTKIEKQVSLIESLPEDYGLVYCWMTYYDAKTGKEIKVHNPQLRGDVSLDVVEKPAVSGTPTFLIKTEAFFKLGGWVSVEESGIGSDWAFGARFCQYYKVDFVPESLVKVYENHGHTRMSNAGSYYSDIDQKILKFHNYFLNTYAEIYKEYPEKGWRHYRGLLNYYVRHSDFHNAWVYYKKLIKAKPGIVSIVTPFVFITKKILRWR